MANAVYDDRDTNLDELEKAFHAPSAETSGSDIARQHEIDALNDKFNNSPDELSEGQKPPKSDDAKTLKDSEESPQYGPSFADSVDERLGLGYTGKGKQNRFTAWLKSGGKNKRRIAIASAVASSLGISGFFFLSAMLPLRIVSIVKTLEAHYMAQAEDGIERMGGRILSDYIRTSIMPSLVKGSCKNTVDPKCVVIPEGTGPFKQLYAAWAKTKLENELATKHGIIISMQRSSTSTPKFFMNIDGKNVDITSIQMGDRSVFELDGTEEVSKEAIRQKVRDALKDGTKWDKTYKRFVVNRYLKQQFGIRHCIFKCEWRDGIGNKIDEYKASRADKKLAARAKTIERLAPQKYQLFTLCILDVNSCTSSLDAANPGDETRLSPAQKQIKTTILDLSAAFPNSKLTGVAEKYAAEGGKLDMSTIIAREMAKKTAARFAGEAAGQATGEVAEKAIPIVGWILLAAHIIHSIDVAPEVLTKVSYALNSHSAVEASSLYSTFAAEQISGNMDSDVAGSMDTSLTAASPDSGQYPSDASSTPLFNAIMNPQGSGTFGHSSSYTCEDGQPVPSDRLTCAREHLAMNSATLIGMRTSLDVAFPGLASVAGAIAKADSFLKGLVGDALSGAVQLACHPPGVPDGMLGALWATNPIGGICKLIDSLGAGMQKIITFMTEQISEKISPVRGDGGRMFDMIAAGEDVTGNRVVRDTLGGMPTSAETVALLRTKVNNEAQSKFQKRPLYARLFDKEDERSFVSRVALSSPRSVTAENNLSNIANLDVGKLLVGFSSLVQPRAHAAVATGNAFGVPQYIVPQDIPNHPTDYWRQNCQQHYNEGTNELDVSTWLNSSTDEDPSTGEQRNLAPNYCLLINTSITAVGVLSGGVTLPPDDLTPTDSTSFDQSAIYESSENIKCDPRTTDLGVQDGYHDGVAVKIRVCAVPNLKSTAGESTPGDPFYVDKADGNAVVNSRVSTQVYTLAEAMRSYFDANHITADMSLASGFRSMAKQTYLCKSNPLCAGGNYTMVARPGYSNHQMGLALDFNEPDPKNPSATSCDNRAKDPGSAVWSWLNTNASDKYGFRQYVVESWHWDVMEGTTRCAGGA